jgi:hypothetical protein
MIGLLFGAAAGMRAIAEPTEQPDWEPRVGDVCFFEGDESAWVIMAHSADGWDLSRVVKQRFHPDAFVLEYPPARVEELGAASTRNYLPMRQEDVVSISMRIPPRITLEHDTLIYGPIGFKRRDNSEATSITGPRETGWGVYSNRRT